MSIQVGLVQLLVTSAEASAPGWKSAGSGASSSRRLRERKGLLPVHGRPRFEPKWRRDKSLMSEIVWEFTAARPSQSFGVPFPPLRVRIFDPASPKACPASAGLDLAPPFPSRRGDRISVAWLGPLPPPARNKHKFLAGFSVLGRAHPRPTPDTRCSRRVARLLSGKLAVVFKVAGLYPESYPGYPVLELRIDPCGTVPTREVASPGHVPGGSPPAPRAHAIANASGVTRMSQPTRCTHAS